MSQREQVLRATRLSQFGAGLRIQGKGARMLLCGHEIESASGEIVRSAPNFIKTLLGVLSVLFLLLGVGAQGQENKADAKAGQPSASNDARLTIVVTAGEEKKPVENASVYIRFVDEHKHGKDKKIEMNLKTNQSGICHVPVIPPGNFLVQVIAEGWKTYGEYYDPGKIDQTINITLARPPKWY